jgi:hypothetical protein
LEIDDSEGKGDAKEDSEDVDEGVTARGIEFVQSMLFMTAVLVEADSGE